MHSQRPYRAFIDDPAHIELVDGQRYVVLRPPPEVRTRYMQVQRAMKDRLNNEPVSFPAEPHITFIGVAEGSTLERVRDVVKEWARVTAPLEMHVENVGSFPAPDQIVILRMRKTTQLLDALIRLRTLALENGLRLLGSIEPAQWIFHMSVAYCSALNAKAWRQLVASVDDLFLDVTFTAMEVEIAAFDNGREYSGGVIQFAATTAGGQRR